MRKLMATGLVILAVGLTFLVVGSMTFLSKVQIKNSYDSLSISENLTKKNTYIIDIQPSSKWRNDYGDGALYETDQPVDVIIDSPDGGKTKLQAFFYATYPSGSYYSPLVFIRVEYQSVDSDSLDVYASYPQIRFTTKQDGIYTANVIEATINWTVGPPGQMTIWKEIYEESVHASLFKNTGLICFFGGVAVSALGLRTDKKVRITQKRKARKIMRLHRQLVKSDLHSPVFQREV